jgi:hypothetical protein
MSSWQRFFFPFCMLFLHSGNCFLVCTFLYILFVSIFTFLWINAMKYNLRLIG